MTYRVMALSLVIAFIHALSAWGQATNTEHLGLVEGLIEPAQTVRIAASETATIQAILVVQGQAVKKGEPLIQMDQDLLLSTLQLAKSKAESRAKLDAANIEVQVKQRRVDNLEKLGKENSSSEELIRARADWELAKTAVLAAEEDIQQNQLEAKRVEVQLEKRTIRSPIAGVVSRIHRQVGEFVTSADPIVVTVVDLHRLRIVINPPSSVAQCYADAKTVRVGLGPGLIKEAKVDFVSPVTDAASDTVRMELLLDNPNGVYRSGSRCWLVDARTAEISLPSTKLLISQGSLELKNE